MNPGCAREKTERKQMKGIDSPQQRNRQRNPYDRECINPDGSVHLHRVAISTVKFFLTGKQQLLLGLGKNLPGLTNILAYLDGQFLRAGKLLFSTQVL
jgi:hypothetical protein